MSAKLGFWILGFLCALIAASTIAEDAFPAARVVVASGVMVVLGLTGEIVASGRSRAVACRPLDDRQADGRIDIAKLRGVRRELNREDERFGSFLGLETDESTTNDDTREMSRKRSPHLLGRVAIVSLFLGRDDVAWTERELSDAHAELIRAGEWIEGQARRYGARVNLEVADTYFVHDDRTPDEVAIGFYFEGDRVGPFEHNAGMKALVRASRAALALGFEDASDLFAQIGARLNVNETIWLIHPRQAGRSFAMPHETSEWEGLSLANCYPVSAPFPERLSGEARIDPVTVVHEILHLFGASDKYGRPLRSFRWKTVTNREVMRLDEVRLDRLRIDPLTAAELGWDPIVT